MIPYQITSVSSRPRIFEFWRERGIVKSAHGPLVHNMTDQAGFFVCLLASDLVGFALFHWPALGDHPAVRIARCEQHDLTCSILAETPRKGGKLGSAVELVLRHAPSSTSTAASGIGQEPNRRPMTIGAPALDCPRARPQPASAMPQSGGAVVEVDTPLWRQLHCVTYRRIAPMTGGGMPTLIKMREEAKS